MRRLVLILLAWLAMVPLLPMPAQASHVAVAPCAACPMHGGHDEGCAIHGCLGCATEAEPAAMLARHPEARAIQPVAVAVATPAQHRPGFDPPPPRAAG